MNRPAYPKYKPSGVDWLGEVPEHWEVVRFSREAHVEEGQVDPEVEPFSDMILVAPNHVEAHTGLLLYKETAAEQGAESGKYFCHAGDVIYSKIRPSLAKVAMAEEDCLCSADMYPIAGRWRLNNKYLFWSLLSRWFIEWSTLESARVAMPKINRETLGACKFCLPPSVEQCAISDFLDRETGRIDTLVRKKRELIVRLKERRAALITRAVTRGLDPAAQLKDSGVEWLGMVPQGWEVKRIKYVAKLESGHTPSRQVAEYWEDCDIPWVSLNDSKQLAVCDYISETAIQINKLGLENSSAHMLPENVVVFTRDATIGLTAITTRPMAVSQHLIAWVPSDEILSSYLLKVFYTMKPYLDSITAGATLKTIGMPEVKKLVTPVPPLEEQRAIADYLDRETGKLDRLTERIETAIERLQEYRAALITAAVTGKIDVRGEANKEAA